MKRRDFIWSRSFELSLITMLVITAGGVLLLWPRWQQLRFTTQLLKERQATVLTAQHETAPIFEEKYYAFPNLSELPDGINSLVRLSKRNEISLIKGAYSTPKEAGLTLAREDLIFDWKGSYINIRSFMSDIGREMDNAKITHISLRSNESEPTMLEGRIAISIYYTRK